MITPRRAARCALTALAAACGVASAQWSQRTISDPMSDTKVRTFTARSLNAHNLAAPYQGATRASLVLRQEGDEIPDVILMIDRGQLLCRPRCDLRIRFDDNPPQDWGANPSGDGSPEIAFLGGESFFLELLRTAKRVRIEAPIYREGLRVWEFKTTNLPDLPTKSQPPK